MIGFIYLKKILLKFRHSHETTMWSYLVSVRSMQVMT